RYLSSRRVGAVRPHGRHERPLVGPPSAPPVSCGFRGGTAVLRVDAVPSPSPLARGFLFGPAPLRSAPPSSPSSSGLTRGSSAGRTPPCLCRAGGPPASRT